MDGHTQEIAFWRGEVSETITESEDPENGGVHAKAHGRDTALDAQQRGTGDGGPFGDHLGCQSASASRALDVLAELHEGTADCERKDRDCARHGFNDKYLCRTGQ